MNSLSQFQIPDLWEVKDVINKVRNVVLNYTEMEAKVHEATNNEPWGASSTLMQEIAQGTFNYQYFNEIMPTLFKRFTEKEAKQWRQIYKALVLLEYLVKNGAERVIDEARSHMATIKILRNFHYIDEKGKDQGINVRNRAKELAELLSDVDKIKAERKKAKHNRNKYTAVASSSSTSGYGGGGSRYGGFGSDSAYSGGGSGYTGTGGGYSGDGYGGSGAFDDEFSDHYGKGKYDDDGSFEDDRSSDRSKKQTTHSDTSSVVSPTTTSKQPAKEVNLFDFDEPAAPSGSKSALPASNLADDDEWGNFSSGGVANDDFDDFQSAAPISSNNAFTAPPATSSKPAVPASKPSQSNDLFDLLGDDSFAPAPSNTSTSPVLSPPISMNPQGISPLAPMGQAGASKASQPGTSAFPAPAGKSNDLWSQASNLVSLDSLGKGTGQNKPTVGPSMNSMKSSATSSEWNSWANSSKAMNNLGAFNQPSQQQSNQQTKPSSNAFDDLLL
ncbi:Epsin-3 [Umbelopsis nana]